MHRIQSLLIVLLLAAAPHARAAESYDNCTGFIDELPATISTQGTWCLRHNLATSIASGEAITVAGNNITIDCNDFKIGGLAAGDGSLAYGIRAEDRQNTTVRHCGIRGFYFGIFLDDGAGHLVEDNRLDNNLYIGIRVRGDNNLVQRNRVFDTGGATGGAYAYGIHAAADIVDNTVSGVFSVATDGSIYGILSYGKVVSGNRISDLTPNGSGWAYGIFGYGNVTVVVGNQIFAGYDRTAGYGIYTALFCANNTVANFATAYSSCGSSIGNLP